MHADLRFGGRFLAVALLGGLAWLAWAGQRRASAELAALRQESARALRSGAAARAEEDRRVRLLRVTGQLAERDAPPASAAGVRARLVTMAAAHGVELSVSRLQPLVRPPASAVGTEAQMNLLGEVSALSRFLGALERSAWPLRTERAQLAVRGGVGTLAATVTVLWPDPAAAFTAEDELRLAADPRLQTLSAWLETAPPPGPAATSRAAPVEPRSTAALPEAAPVSPPSERIPPVETPQLHGFVNLGEGAPVQAALFYRGETILVGAGDRLGEYTVLELEPADTVLLSRPGTPPLRLSLRE